ncbi:MAG TPA: hypothetical protein VLR88_08140 [Propionibacteriaceae bacterium]|nr:hypothetical protein [Propionibacteriaceae bacterium]
MSVGVLVLSFDLYNVGDLDLVRQVRRRCETVVAGVLTDSEVRARTGRPPVVPLTHRLQIARSIRGVDDAIVFEAGNLAGLAPGTVVYSPVHLTGVHQVLVPERETASALLRETLAGCDAPHAAA